MRAAGSARQAICGTARDDLAPIERDGADATAHAEELGPGRGIDVTLAWPHGELEIPDGLAACGRAAVAQHDAMTGEHTGGVRRTDDKQDDATFDADRSHRPQVRPGNAVTRSRDDGLLHTCGHADDQKSM